MGGAIILGVVYALFCESIAFIMLGAGHGWVTPFWVGPLGLIVFPLCGYAAFSAGEEGKRHTIALILAVVSVTAANWILVDLSLEEELRYIERLSPLSYIWITFWLGGQIPLLFALSRRASILWQRRET